MRKKGLCVKMMAATLAATMVMGLGACGSSYSEMTVSTGSGMKNSAATAPESAMDYEYGFDESVRNEVHMEESMEVGATSSGSGQNSAYYEERKLIRTVNLDLETKEFDVMFGVLDGKDEIKSFMETHKIK